MPNTITRQASKIVGKSAIGTGLMVNEAGLLLPQGIKPATAEIKAAHKAVRNESKGLLGGISSVSNYLSTAVFALPLIGGLAKRMLKGRVTELPEQALTQPGAYQGFTKFEGPAPTILEKTPSKLSQVLKAIGNKIRGFFSWTSEAAHAPLAPKMANGVPYNGFTKFTPPSPSIGQKIGGAFKAIGKKISGGFAWAVHPITKHIPTETLQRFTKITELSEVELGKLPDALKKLRNPNAAEQMASEAGKVASSASKLGGYIKNIVPKFHGKVMQASTANAVFAGAGAVGDMAMAGTTMKQGILAVKAVQTDLTGKMPSTWQVITGSHLHPLARKAREEVFGKRGMGGILLQLGGGVANGWLMLRSGQMKNFLPKTIALSMGTNMVASMVTSGQTINSSYRSLVKSFKLYNHGELNDYMGLIGGLATNANNEVIEKIAQKAYEQQLHARGVLKLVAETKFLTQPVADKGQKPVKGKFTQALASDGIPQSEVKPVQGKFTAALTTTPAAPKEEAKLVQGAFTAREETAKQQAAIRA